MAKEGGSKHFLSCSRSDTKMSSFSKTSVFVRPYGYRKQRLQKYSALEAFLKRYNVYSLRQALR